MKKIALLLLSLFLLLTACNSSDSNTSSTSGSEESFFYTHITAEFEVDVPKDWETIDGFTNDYPEEIRVAFRNNIKDSDFVANVNIIREENKNNLTNADFGQEKLNQNAETLISYQLLSQESVTLLVGGAESETLLNTFEGKSESSSELIQFMQTYLVKGDKAYAITASYLPEEDPFVIEKIDTILKSFTLK